jgi:hypothetical protein
MPVNGVSSAVGAPLVHVTVSRVQLGRALVHARVTGQHTRRSCEDDRGSVLADAMRDRRNRGVAVAPITGTGSMVACAPVLMLGAAQAMPASRGAIECVMRSHARTAQYDQRRSPDDARRICYNYGVSASGSVTARSSAWRHSVAYASLSV